MENNTTPTNSTPAPHPAKAKTPLVKRIKIPTVRPGEAAPAQQPAPENNQVKNNTQESTEKQETQTTTEMPVQNIQETPHEQEAPHEPDLPPEDEPTPLKTPATPTVTGKKSLRKKRHSTNNAQSDEQKTDQEKTLKNKIKLFFSKKWNRRLFFITLIFLIGYGSYLALPIIARKKLPEIFAENGISFKTFKVKQITFTTIELTHLSDKTGSMNISSIKFKYSLFGLLYRRTLKSIELTGVTIKGYRRNDGISLGVLNNLIYSPIEFKQDKVFTVKSLDIKNGNFILRNDMPVNANQSENENDGTIVVSFSSKGSFEEKELNMTVFTDYNSSKASFKTKSALKKTASSSEITTEITDGKLLKDEKETGAITGNMAVSVNNGVLSKGEADLLLSSSDQKLNLKAAVIPKEKSFDITVDLNRSFENSQEAKGKFGGDLSIKADNTVISGTFEKFEGTLPLILSANTLTNGKIAIQDMKTKMDLKFACNKGVCNTTLQNPMTLSFSGLQYLGNFRQIRTLAPLELTVNPNPDIPFMKSEKGNVTFHLPVTPLSTQIFIADTISNSQASLALNELTANLTYNVFSGKHHAEATFNQSSFANNNINLTGIQGFSSFNSGSLPDVRLRIQNASLAQANVLADFSADLRFRPMSASEFGVDASIALKNGLVTANANGSYTLPTHEWNMYLVVPKFILSDSGVNFETVAPFMLNYLPNTTTGGIAAKGRLNVKNGQVTGPMNVLLENVSTTWKGIGVNSLNGVVTLSSVLPLGTPENQQLFIGNFNIGVPMQNALFNFQIFPNKGVEIANARMKYANGQFKTIKSFYVPYEGEASQILFEGSGIDLAVVTNNLTSSALQVDGIMNSEWRLSLDDDKLLVEDVLFTSKLPGTLHYYPPKAIKEKMDPEMATFLKDVIVKNMEIRASGELNGLMAFTVSITGHSPLDEEQNDQELSFDFQGSLRSFLKQKNHPIEIPSDILLAIQEYTKK